MACLHRLDGSRRHGWRFDSRNLSRLCNLLGRLRGLLRRLRGFHCGLRGRTRHVGHFHMAYALRVRFGGIGNGNS